MPSVMGSSSRHRRHSKQSSSSTASTSPKSSKKTTAPPAALPLASRYSSSSRSDVSDAQVTPRSIFHSSLRPSRRAGKDTNTQLKRENNNGKEKCEVRPTDGDSTGPNKENLDVFAFMENDDDRASPSLPPTERGPPPSELHAQSTHNLILRDNTSRASASSSSSSEPESESDSSPPIFTARRILSPARSPRYSDLEVRAIQDGGQRAWTRGSLHSDSGISMQSTSPEQERDSPILQHKYPMIEEQEVSDCLEADVQPRLSEDNGGEQERLAVAGISDSPEFLAVDNNPQGQPCQPGFGRNRHNISSELAEDPREVDYPGASTSPPQQQAYAYGSSGSPSFAPTAIPDLHEMSAPSNLQQHRRPSIYELPPKPRRRSHPLQYPEPSSPPSAASPPPPSQQERQAKTGYNLLASSIAVHNNPVDGVAAMLRPIYRKFETLNNRMLLHLQDEIAELESYLAGLDAAIAADQKPGTTATGPESRRDQVRLVGVSQLEWQRQEVLGRCFGKVEQYSRALTTYAQLSRELTPARPDDVERYRKWIAEHTPIAPSECEFLDDITELVAVPSSPGGRVARRTHPPHQHQQNDEKTTTTRSLRDGSYQLEQMRKLDAAPTIFLTFIAIVIVFKFVPGLISRLVVAAMLGLGAWVAGMGNTASGGGKGWKLSRKGVMAWMGVVGVLAVVVN